MFERSREPLLDSASLHSKNIMSAQLIDGKKLAANIHSELKEDIKRLGITPGLAVLLVGDDPASHTYVRLKEKAASEIGIHFEKILLPQNIEEELVLAKIDALNRRSDIHGIVVQMPLPAHLNEDRVAQEIFPEKDADGFHPKNIKLLMAGTPRVVPNLLQAILYLIESTRMPLVMTRGILVKNAVILANSTIIARPLVKLLKDHAIAARYKLQIPNDKTMQETDILIVALGKPHRITKNMVKDGGIVIDVGTTRVDGKIVGDVHPNVAEKAKWLTPVPGGIGPLTVAYLLKNVVELAKQAQKKNPT